MPQPAFTICKSENLGLIQPADRPATGSKMSVWLAWPDPQGGALLRIAPVNSVNLGVHLGKPDD
jgi:hypothetical protein